MSESVIYFIKRESDGLIKIGYTKWLASRLSGIRADVGNITLLGIIQGGKVREHVLHWCFQSQRVYGEWFKPSEELNDLIFQYACIPETESKTGDEWAVRMDVRLNEEYTQKLQSIAKNIGTDKQTGRGRPSAIGIDYNATIEWLIDVGLPYSRLNIKNGS